MMADQLQFRPGCQRAWFAHMQKSNYKYKYKHNYCQNYASRSMSSGHTLRCQLPLKVALTDPFLSTSKMNEIILEFQRTTDVKDKYKLLIEYSNKMPSLTPHLQVAENRVMGCTAQVWLTASLDEAGRVVFAADSDSAITRGVAAVMAAALSGLPADEILELDSSFLDQLELGPAVSLTSGRVVGAANILETMKKRTRALLGELPRFPSILITHAGISAQGAFAEAQAAYLSPDPNQVTELASLLSTKKAGVVAHFYMDPQVQGVLTSAADLWPHIAISDSLVMADTAVRMAAAGCTTIAVLGVDFMSENVRAILDSAGYTNVKVFRMSSHSIGCSLAEAAESPAYERYLQEASATPNSLHVVYINTSLRSKAHAQTLVPTISCTSSNVVSTVLQGFAQIPDATIWYGPDTYMGRNLAELFTSLAAMSDDEIRTLHPGHDRQSVRSLLPRLRYFEDGTCIVHQLFGGEVCDLVAAAYNDAYLTAHFEVPGEMFRLAMAARQRGRGVVGSTSNILDFISERVTEALSRQQPERLVFVLGTEAGMATSIVRAVQRLIQKAGRQDVDVELVFPVSPQAIATDRQASASGVKLELPKELAALPGPAGGEGCSLEGGCASCPYMKMNSLAALQKVLQAVGDPIQEALLAGYTPKPYSETMSNGQTVAQTGCVPILHMRHFQKNKVLPDELVQDVLARNKH